MLSIFGTLTKVFVPFSQRLTTLYFLYYAKINGLKKIAVKTLFIYFLLAKMNFCYNYFSQNNISNKYYDEKLKTQVLKLLITQVYFMLIKEKKTLLLSSINNVQEFLSSFFFFYN